MSSIYVEYVGKRLGSFNVTTPAGRVYRVSKYQPLIPVDENEVAYFGSRSDFIVPRRAAQNTRPTGARSGPRAVAETFPVVTPARTVRKVDDRGTKKVVLTGL